MSVDDWNRHAKLYERSFERASWFWAQNALTLAGFVEPLEKPKTLLDIACGPGRFAVVAAQLGFEVTAIDCAEKMVQYTRERALAAHVDITAMVADGQHLESIENDSYDVVASQFGLVCLPDRDAAWQAMHRVLKPGGQLMMSIWSFEGFPVAFLVYAEIHAEECTSDEKTTKAPKNVEGPNWNGKGSFDKNTANRVMDCNSLQQELDLHGFNNGAVYKVRHDVCFSSGQECIELLLDNVVTLLTLRRKDVRSVKICLAYYIDLVSQGINPITDREAPLPPKLADGVVAEEMPVWNKPVVVPGYALIATANKPL